jgi:aspartate racemase
MHIGLIVGIGPAATDYYYRYLIAAMARAGVPLQLTMAHADTPTLLRNQAQGDVAGQVEIYCELTERLHRAGVAHVAVTSIAGHFCIDAFKRVSPVTVIDLLDVVQHEVEQRGLKRVGLLGTRVVMESRLYGVLAGVEVIAPDADVLTAVHDAYVAMASAGVATAEHRDIFFHAGQDLAQKQGCESVLLAGTDLALVFKPGASHGFDFLDCAQVHAAAIAEVAQRMEPVLPTT